MKEKILLFLITISFFLTPFKGITQINQQDSLALVDLYNSTNGPGWINNTNWLTTAPVSTWHGVFIVQNNRIKFLNLRANKLVGSIPSSLANLSVVFFIDLSINQLSGNIPASLSNITAPFTLDLSYNQLNGAIPSLTSSPPFNTIRLNNNQFTFSNMEEIITKPIVIYSPQADIPLIKNGNILSVAVGGTLSNNTYKWYKDDSLISTKTGDSTLSITDNGNYSVIVTNSIATQLTLYSINTTNTQDSLALVELYNSTNGQDWINSTNWLTPAPACTWHGVTVRNNRVKELQLFSNHLTDTLPSSLGNLPDLSIIKFYSNQLSGNLPSSLGNLSNLITLDLANNQFRSSIPSSLGNLSNLTILNLYNNQFSDSIPSSLGNLSNLTFLELGNNQFSGSIPSSLGNLSNLTRLALAKNQLSGSIPSSLGNLNNLTDLYLYNNQLSGSIPLFQKTQMNAIDISNNAFTFSGMEQLPMAQSRIYFPQATIPLTKTENLLSVSAGGTLANDSFFLFKNGALSKIQGGDSVFTITNSGEYYITVTNRLAPKLTLYSDTVTIDMDLADTTTTVIQNISGNSATDISDGVFKLVTLTPGGGANALAGNVTATVTIDTAVSSYKSQPYVQRHYDIVPAQNAGNAEATVTLYFTQEDFDNFNNYIAANNLNIPLLPGGGVDNGNVRIIQFHGTFTGSSAPENYSDSNATFITPNVAWDNVENWWVVTFPVTGFSGFYVSTANIALPLTLLQFSGELKNNKVNLAWTTTNETATKEFEIQRQENNKFIVIGKIAAISASGIHAYSFTDNQSLPGNSFYRLKMIDKDGNFTYSYILPIKIIAEDLKLTVYPNPVINTATLSFTSIKEGIYQIKITDFSGRIIKRISGSSTIGINKININLASYAGGNYFITLIDEKNLQHSLKLSKQ